MITVPFQSLEARKNVFEWNKEGVLIQAARFSFLLNQIGDSVHFSLVKPVEKDIFRISLVSGNISVLLGRKRVEKNVALKGFVKRHRQCLNTSDTFGRLAVNVYQNVEKRKRRAV